MPQAVSRSTIPIQSLPKVLPSATRKIVATAIKRHMAATEALIAFLDQVDGDPEEEPCVTDLPHDADPDEASLGWTQGMNQEKALKDSVAIICMPGGGSTGWAPRNSDLEAEHDGREPDDDAEPEPGEPDTADDEPRCPPTMCGGAL